jgi:hypothetical protein
MKKRVLKMTGDLTLGVLAFGIFSTAILCCDYFRSHPDSGLKIIRIGCFGKRSKADLDLLFIGPESGIGTNAQIHL